MKGARINTRMFNRGPLKVIAVVTLWSFLFSSTLGGVLDRAWAVETTAAPTDVGERDVGKPSDDKVITPEAFTLPPYLGTVKERWVPKQEVPAGNRRTIIHIQDAHCNYGCQHRVADIIGHLNKYYGIDIVNLEGGQGNYDLSMFQNIYDPDVREKVTDLYVQEGVVSGAEYFAATNPDTVKLWGVEDPDFYFDNLDAYRKSLTFKETAEEHLQSLEHILNNLKRHIYSDELMDLDAKYTEYKENKLEFHKYITYLIEKARSKEIDIKAFTNIDILDRAFRLEKEIDFKKADLERDELIEELEEKLSPKEKQTLVLKTIEFRTERISQKEFYKYLVRKAEFVRINMEDFPQLNKFVTYVSMYEEIDKPMIMNEISELEGTMKEMLFKNDKQRQLDILSKHLTLTKNMFNVILTKADYRYYKEHEASFDTENFISFIKREAPLYNIRASLDENIKELDGFRADMTKFYDLSFKRDEAFLKNLEFTGLEAKKKGPEVTILVTGGFHTENLCDLFKENNMSYISIIPNFKNPKGYESPYFKVLGGGDGSPLDEFLQKVISAALPASALAVPSLVSEMGITDMRQVATDRGIAPQARFKNLLGIRTAVYEAIIEERPFIIDTVWGTRIVIKEGQFTEDVSNTRTFTVNPRRIGGQLSARIYYTPNDSKEYAEAGRADIVDARITLVDGDTMTYKQWQAWVQDVSGNTEQHVFGTGVDDNIEIFKGALEKLMTKTGVPDLLGRRRRALKWIEENYLDPEKGNLVIWDTGFGRGMPVQGSWNDGKIYLSGSMIHDRGYEYAAMVFLHELAASREQYRGKKKGFVRRTHAENEQLNTAYTEYRDYGEAATAQMRATARPLRGTMATDGITLKNAVAGLALDAAGFAMKGNVIHADPQMRDDARDFAMQAANAAEELPEAWIQAREAIRNAFSLPDLLGRAFGDIFGEADIRVVTTEQQDRLIDELIQAINNYKPEIVSALLKNKANLMERRGWKERDFQAELAKTQEQQMKSLRSVLGVLRNQGIAVPTADNSAQTESDVQRVKEAVEIVYIQVAMAVMRRGQAARERARLTREADPVAEEAAEDEVVFEEILGERDRVRRSLNLQADVLGKGVSDLDPGQMGTADLLHAFRKAVNTVQGISGAEETVWRDGDYRLVDEAVYHDFTQAGNNAAEAIIAMRKGGYSRDANLLVGIAAMYQNMGYCTEDIHGFGTLSVGHAHRSKNFVLRNAQDLGIEVGRDAITDARTKALICLLLSATDERVTRHDWTRLRYAVDTHDTTRITGLILEMTGLETLDRGDIAGMIESGELTFGEDLLRGVIAGAQILMVLNQVDTRNDAIERQNDLARERRRDSEKLKDWLASQVVLARTRTEDGTPTGKPNPMAKWTEFEKAYLEGFPMFTGIKAVSIDVYEQRNRIREGIETLGWEVPNTDALVVAIHALVTLGPIEGTRAAQVVDLRMSLEEADMLDTVFSQQGRYPSVWDGMGRRVLRNREIMQTAVEETTTRVRQTFNRGAYDTLMEALNDVLGEENLYMSQVSQAIEGVTAEDIMEVGVDGAFRIAIGGVKFALRQGDVPAPKIAEFERRAQELNIENYAIALEDEQLADVVEAVRNAAAGISTEVPLQFGSIAFGEAIRLQAGEITNPDEEMGREYLKQNLQTVAEAVNVATSRDLNECWAYGIGSVPTEADGREVPEAVLASPISGVGSAVRHMVEKKKIENVNVRHSMGDEKAREMISEIIFNVSGTAETPGVEASRIRCSISQYMFEVLDTNGQLLEKLDRSGLISRKTGETYTSVKLFLAERTMLNIVDDVSNQEGMATAAMPYAQITLEGMAKLNLAHALERYKAENGREPSIEDDAIKPALNLWARTLGLLEHQRNIDAIIADLKRRAEEEANLTEFFIVKPLMTLLPPVAAISAEIIKQKYLDEAEVLRAL